MRIGLFGLIVGDLTDVDYDKVRFASELGFHGLGAHLTVPAETISERTIAAARSSIAEQNLDFLQLWGQYPCIISPDESVRRAGVAQVREIVKLASRLGVPGAGVRPTSLNPRGDWWPHPDNFKPETEERFIKSLKEILEAADDYGVSIILEAHQTTLLRSPQAVRRVIEQSGSTRVKVNLDPCNFIYDLQTAFNPKPLIEELFAELGTYAATVHLKDYYLEDRFVVHIAETVIGTGLMDWETVLRCAQATLPHGYVVIEHLPVNLVALAKRNLTQTIKELGIPLDANR